MTSLSVPSTLVKCLYLFFDLPEMKDADAAEPGNEFNPRERRILLQKIFVQVCTYGLWLIEWTTSFATDLFSFLITIL